MNMKYSFLGLSITLLAVLFFIGSCKTDDSPGEKNWELVWADEFNGSAGESPDATKWVFEAGTNWGNNQLEYNTTRPENVSTDGNGNLAIVAKRESFQGADFTSGRISTRGKFTQAYGRFEARIQMPRGFGVWPAFWMLGEACEPQLFSSGVCCNGNDGWPDCGEIDIVEMRGQEPTVIHGSLHGPGYSAASPITTTYTLAGGRFDTEFHVFAVEWTEEGIDFFMDDQMYQSVAPEDAPGDWVFNTPNYLILNVALGGGFVGGGPNASTPLPQTMLVDYVRVYKEAP
jgi:beta-glucanase (GH16 family)